MKDILKNYTKYYKENLKIKHIICTLISLLMFIIFLVANIKDYSNVQGLSYNNQSYFNALGESALLSFIIIFAGITPYCFLSVMGILAIYNVALKVAVIYILSQNIFSIVGFIIVSIFICIAYSLCMATGIQYCILSTKKFSYNQKKGFKFDDLKMSIYKLRGNEKKLKVCEEKRKKYIEKAEKLNVKIPYLNFSISFIISCMILILTNIVIR